MSYVVESSAVFGHLNDLDRRLVADVDTDIGRQGHLRQTECPRVWVVGRADNLERRHDRVAHVLRRLPEAQVDVDQGPRMAREPAGLDSDCSAADGPLGAVGGRGHASA